METLEGYALSHIMRKPIMPYANNKGTDQTAHPCSLISAFVVRCLDSIIPPLAIAEISRQLVSVSEQAGLSYLVENPKDRFSRDVAHLCIRLFQGISLITVKLLNIRTPKKVAVIALKYEHGGFTIEWYIQKKERELQTV